MAQHRCFGKDFKARAAIEAVKGGKTINEIASIYLQGPSQPGFAVEEGGCRKAARCDGGFSCSGADRQIYFLLVPVTYGNVLTYCSDVTVTGHREAVCVYQDKVLSAHRAVYAHDNGQLHVGGQ